MEPNLQNTVPAGEIVVGASFASRLAALAAGKPAPDAPHAGKRAASLTRRFFGGKDGNHQAQDAARISPVGETAVQGFSPVEAAPDHEPTRAADLPPDAADELPLPPPAAFPLPPPRLTVPSFQHPPPTMTPTPPNDSTPAGRASAQLTLGFEITSLQLSPFFRLGAVQLRALSNVVSLHLVAARGADEGLAAGISFGIERVELDDDARLKSLLLKPLGESREAAAPGSRLHVESVALAGENEGNPISVTTSGAASTVVQLVGTFAIAAMEFTPAFEIDSLRLEPSSQTVLLRVAPSSGPDAHKLPSSFDLAEVQLDDEARVRGARLVPSTAGHA